MRSHHQNESTRTSPHTAKYLILLGSPEAKRALLFSGECEYMAEMIDEDGLVLDHLLRSSIACPPPGDLGLDDKIFASCAANEMLLCFALGETSAA